MALNFNNFETVLQTKLDTITDEKDMLLLGKAIEATVGNVTVSEIQAEAATQKSAVTAEGGTQISAVQAQGTSERSQINAMSSGFATTSSLSPVATSGSAADLSNLRTVGGQSIAGVGGDIATLPSGGSVGQVIKKDASNNPAWAADSGGLQSMQSFTSTGSYTWTKPTGINLIKVYVTGGGGGTNNPGGGSHSTGGAGGTAIKIIDVSAVTSTTLTVGAGGGGTSSGVAGAGGTSSFGSYCSATGGKGGYDGTANGVYHGGGFPGVGVNGTINLRGGGGGRNGGLNHNMPGGSSYWGGAGNGHHDTHVGYASLSGTHGGGGGATYESTSLSNGGNGVVLVEEYA